MPGTAIEHRQQSQISLCAFSSLLFYAVKEHPISASRVLMYHSRNTRYGRQTREISFEPVSCSETCGGSHGVRGTQYISCEHAQQNSLLCSPKTNGCISMLEAPRHTLELMIIINTQHQSVSHEL